MRRLVTEVGLRCGILPEPISIDEIGLIDGSWACRPLGHYTIFGFACEGTMDARSESRRYSRRRVSRNLPVLVSFMAPRHDQLANDHLRTRRNVFVVGWNDQGVCRRARSGAFPEFTAKFSGGANLLSLVSNSESARSCAFRRPESAAS